VTTEGAIAFEDFSEGRLIAEISGIARKDGRANKDESRDVSPNCHGIVGDSVALKKVWERVKIVAPTDATVLIMGETGTGKEMIARAVHTLSSRRVHAFVEVNCAAIPLGLLESELFGHERGAFTGAITRRIGRFELAHRGTLFLDEIGDIPLEVQPKLLRVLQGQEFERLGSTRTISTDARLVVATNRNLEQMTKKREFRTDLFYRLNIFPIEVPPLRHRSEDIPLLVWHFVEKYAQQLQKPIEAIPPEAMEALMRYHWPGNIRELQYFIQRAVILSRTTVLDAPLDELQRSRTRGRSEVETLREVEQEHILEALRRANWVVGGPNGAAARLGMSRTTLVYRMRSLGICRPRNNCRSLIEQAS